MTTTTFVPGTIIESSWLNDVNTMTYKSFINVKTYGALGDGSTDDTAAIQAALDAAAAADGGEVFFPAGIYMVTTGLSLATGCSMRGGNPRTTELKTTSLTGDVLTLAGSSASVYGLGFTCASMRTAGRYISMSAAARDNVIEDFILTNAFIGIEVGTAGAGVVITHINKGEIFGIAPTDGVGIKISGGNDTYISNMVITSTAGALTECKAGVQIQHSGAVWMHTVDCISTRVGLLVDPGTSQAITWCFFTACAFDSGVAYGIKIAPTTGGSVVGLYFSNCWSSTNSHGLYVTEAGGGVVDGVEFNSGRMINNQYQGLLVDGGSNVNLRDSAIAGNSVVSVGGHAGVLYNDSVTNFAVTGNTLGATYGLGVNHSYGLAVGTSCDSYVIIGNTLLGNVTAGLSDGSSGTAALRVCADNLGWVNNITGTASGTTDGSGDITVTHGMSGTPTQVVASTMTSTYYHVQAHTLGATTFKLRIYDAAGAPVLATATPGIAWTANFK
jgi:hypothetical protein